MPFSLFINFDANCLEAAEFYAKAFDSKVEELMFYKDAPPDPDNPVVEADKDLVMYCQVSVLDFTVMFMDMPSGMPLVKGNNISPTVSLKDEAELTRVFNALKEGGTVDAPLQETFWSPLYGMVTDKFGIGWQIMMQGEMEG